MCKSDKNVLENSKSQTETCIAQLQERKPWFSATFFSILTLLQPSFSNLFEFPEDLLDARPKRVVMKNNKPYCCFLLNARNAGEAVATKTHSPKQEESHGQSST